MKVVLITLTLIAAACCADGSLARNFFSQYRPPEEARQGIIQVNIIPRNGAEDPRTGLNHEENRYGSAVGFFHGANDLTQFVGSGFAAFNRRAVLTAAHNFGENGQWNSFVRQPDNSLNIAGGQFYSDTCGRSYDLKSLYTLVGTGRENDVALVVLVEPLCAEALPLAIQSLRESNVDHLIKTGRRNSSYIRLIAFQWLKRMPKAEADLSPRPQVKRPFGKMTDAGRFLRYLGDSRKLVVHDISLLPGASGGPLMARFANNQAPNTPVAIAISIAEHTKEPFNVARIIDSELHEWAKEIAERNP